MKNNNMNDDGLRYYHLWDDEFLSSLEDNLKKQYSFNENLYNQRISKLKEHLLKAATSLHKAGLNKESECIVMISQELDDPYLEGLDSDKMLKNLEEKGWVFNTDDHNVDRCMVDDCMQCLEDKQPQLSQKELKKLRALINK